MYKTALYNALRIGAVLVPVAVVGYLGYELGHSTASQAYQTELARQAKIHATSMQKLADDKAAELGLALAEQQRLIEQANQVGWALIQTRAQLADTQSQLKKRIADATRTDGMRFTGLGADSLRVYRAALGYPERDPGVPPADTPDAGAANNAATPGGGLPPEDLLAHAADYGQWCQQQSAQLSAYLRLHQEAQP
ncbi:hypothetical protein LH427_09630 [Laribacter hongkongensis]|uniref:hypothetical protein n=1 Tax=Laribacter hongkongensis TaxID=168471 RepID=UPI001EFE7913|nr:hypothetical protein [Laribacter hongkongensis]MCG8993232.1 hypothetical protein [Laribacter hongkongensis]MCG8997949.1 hypothetical protein [Laribacter hongkongensis]MCG9002340.1 hypothetical protein [Laribacter hongkongensis]MCG9005650.1 hypothetical protein [Laribacter hongkongensis]MCG9008787.1 hypothetical protein [Laribacter hongkongensis]